MRMKFIGLVAAVALNPVFSHAQSANFVPPPRTISDIEAVLAQEKPDPVRLERLNSDANVEPPAGLNRAKLAQFLHGRGEARWALGRAKDAERDFEKAMVLAREAGTDSFRSERLLWTVLTNGGYPKHAIKFLQQKEREYNKIGTKGRLFPILRWQTIAHIHLGEFGGAETALRKAEALLQQSRNWPNVEQYRRVWEWQISEARARVLEARGKFREAEHAYRATWQLNTRLLDNFAAIAQFSERDGLELNRDWLKAFEGRVKARQGRLAEAEADVRTAVLSRLRSDGRYNIATLGQLNLLCSVLLEQRRFAEAESVARAILESHEVLGTSKDSQNYVMALNTLAGTLQVQRRLPEANEYYARADAAMQEWDSARTDRWRANSGRIITLYNTGQIDEGIELAKQLVAKETQRLGANDFSTGLAKGVLAMGFAAARRENEALQLFREAIPILLAAVRESDGETSVAQRDERLRNIVESYLGVLARGSDKATLASEGFRVAEAARGRSVQAALAAAGARTSVKNAALGELIRREQDLSKQVVAQLSAINNALALPANERDEKALTSLRTEAEKLRSTWTKTRREIEQKFPDYQSLIDPAPVTLDQIRAVLKLGEAFIAFYFGRRQGYAWAVGKEGEIAVAVLPFGAGELEDRVNHLRRALEAEASTVSDIPPFDLKAAHELYRDLLDPIRDGWQNASRVVVIAHGAIGLLPLGLLPTAAVELKADSGLPFTNYREVPWLAQTHAISLVPSGAALRSLRTLPPGPKSREKMIGFGDPYFSAEQAGEATPETSQSTEGITTRGLALKRRSSPQTSGLNSADLSLLPRLPDTAEELRSIALALEADPSKVINLGKDANERRVKGTDLTKYKIVAFATHGLTPGEINGLNQPALALSSPQVADVDGDGLLTMDEVLGLRLDADWVLLSACNTGAGSGAGAEAASGLARAFFYAGTRAVLVTNWSVHSESARELISGLFQAHEKNPSLTRAEALRQSITQMINNGAYKDASGKPVFSYAHPLFWAPYSIIGDGG